MTSMGILRVDRLLHHIVVMIGWIVKMCVQRPNQASTADDGNSSANLIVYK